MTGYLCRNAQVARFFVGKEMHMNYEKLSGSIRAVIDRRPKDNGAYSDLFSLCREWETEDFSAAHKLNKELLTLSGKFPDRSTLMESLLESNHTVNLISPYTPRSDPKASSLHLQSSDSEALRPRCASAEKQAVCTACLPPHPW